MSVDINIDEKTLKRAFKRLAKMPEEVRRDARKQINKEARKVKKTVKQAVPVRSKNTDPILRERKDGHALYYPGNLRNSIDYLDSRLKNVGDLVRAVGPKFRKSNYTGRFGGSQSKTDPYYWYMWIAHTAGSLGADPFKTAHDQHARKIFAVLEKIVFKAVDNVNKGT